HAEAYAVSGSAAAQSVRAPCARDVERRALDVLPSERAANGDAQVLTRDLGGREPIQRQSRDAPRRIAFEDPQRAEMIAAIAGGVQGPEEISVGQLGVPGRKTAARRVVFRRQIRWIRRAG